MDNKARNYMCVGTIFEKDGTTYVVREVDTNTCAGCAFYSITSEGKPECKGISLPCDGDYREDGKNVVYEPLKTGGQC